VELEEARQILNQPPDARTFRLIRAATAICAPDNADRVGIVEIVACLKLGNQSREYALIAECAATALYSRTNRNWPSCTLAVTNVDDWLAYLIEHKFL